MDVFRVVSYVVLVSSLCGSLLLGGCSANHDDVKDKRAKLLKNTDTISIAVVWDRTIKEFMFVEGARMAAEELNARGGIDGKKLKLKIYYAKDDAEEINLARKIAKDPTLSAVIGHRQSVNALAAGAIYDYNGLLYLTPSQLNNILRYYFTFRLMPSDDETAAQLAQYMKIRGHRKVAIIDDRSPHGKNFGNGIAEALGDVGIEVSIHRFYLPGKMNYKALCVELNNYDLDAIVISGSLPEAADFISDARQMGLRQQLYGSMSLESDALARLAPGASQGMVVPTSLGPEQGNTLATAFFTEFRSRYKSEPDTRAAIGYDAVRLIADVVRQCRSSDPQVLASNLEFFRNWPGVTGSYTYKLNGDLVDKLIYFKLFNGAHFEFINFSGARRQGNASSVSH